MIGFIVGTTKINDTEDGVLTYVGKEYGRHTWEDIDGEKYYWGVACSEDNTLGCNVTEDIQSPTKLKEDVKVMHETLRAKVKSTGSSSDYYKVVLPEWLLLKQKGNGFIMLEDLAEVVFDNDFNYVNVMKAQKRMFDLEGGRGKEGNTFEYDATKCKYYIDKQVEVFNREQENN